LTREERGLIQFPACGLSACIPIIDRSVGKVGLREMGGMDVVQSPNLMLQWKLLLEVRNYRNREKYEIGSVKH